MLICYKAASIGKIVLFDSQANEIRGSVGLPLDSAF